MKKALILSLSLLLILAVFTGCQEEVEEVKLFNEGTYNATTPGYLGPLTVEVTLSQTEIVDVTVTEHMETPGVGTVAMETMTKQIVDHQSLAIDTMAGATMTSLAILRTVEQCIEEAEGDIAALKEPIEKDPVGDIEKTADVVIIGAGGAGLSAAVAAINEGASVILIETTGFVGGNSIVSGGIYNTPNPELQDYLYDERSSTLESLIVDAINETPVSAEHEELMELVKQEYEEYLESDKTLFDSSNWFALQTWNGGDKVADLGLVKILAHNAYDGLKWMESMGMVFGDQVSHGGGALYPRTHWAELPNGTGYIQALISQLEDNPNFTLMLETTGVDLINEGNKVVGVNAEGREGNKVTLYANNGVIITTGGFAGNVELRQTHGEGEKWPDLGPHIPTSNMDSVTGHGLVMASESGGELVNMEHIQLLPYCNPNTGATYDIVAGRGAMVFINKEGERFVREDGRRDEMSRAIIEQTDGIIFMLQSADGIPNPEEARALGGQKLTYYLETGHAGYVAADTLEELAEKMGVPADNLIQTVENFNSYVESGDTDPFGVVSYGGKLETGPFYAYPRRPAVHHTMGGIRIDEQARVVREDGTIIEGLFAAGEISGNLHGANRLGGNAIVDFVVFGRIAGEAATK